MRSAPYPSILHCFVTNLSQQVRTLPGSDSHVYDAIGSLYPTTIDDPYAFRCGDTSRPADNRPAVFELNRTHRHINNFNKIARQITAKPGKQSANLQPVATRNRALKTRLQIREMSLEHSSYPSVSSSLVRWSDSLVWRLGRSLLIRVIVLFRI
jgi:hypothetical protein